MIVEVNDLKIDISTPQVGNVHDIAIQEELLKIKLLYKGRKNTKEKVDIHLLAIMFHVNEKKREHRLRQAEILRKKKK